MCIKLAMKQKSSLSTGLYCYAIPTGIASMYWSEAVCTKEQPYIKLEVESIGADTITFRHLLPMFFTQTEQDESDQSNLMITALNRVGDAGFKLFLELDHLIKYLNQSQLN